MSTFPELASLQNVDSRKYLAGDPVAFTVKSLQCDAQFRDSFISPHCVFQFIPSDAGNGGVKFAIKNMENHRYLSDPNLRGLSPGQIASSGPALAPAQHDDQQQWTIHPVEQHWHIRNSNTGYHLLFDSFNTSRLRLGNLTSGDKRACWGLAALDPDPLVSSWMGDNWEWIGRRQLNMICLPVSHDAGTFEATHVSALATERVTRTQLYDIGLQLKQGIRVFDLRPVIYEGEFHTHHSNVSGAGLQGAVGVSLSSAFDQINDFAAVDAHRKELIVLIFNKPYNWDEERTFNEEDKNRFMEFVEARLSRRLVRGKAGKLTYNSIAALIGPDHERTNVIALSHIFPHKTDSDDREFRLWNLKEHFFPLYGEFSATEDLDLMQSRQLSSLQGTMNFGSRWVDNEVTRPIVRLYWQRTLSVEHNIGGSGGTSIIDLAQAANRLLEPVVTRWIDQKIMSHRMLPNMIYMDACEESVTHAVKLSILIGQQLQAEQEGAPRVEVTRILLLDNPDKGKLYLYYEDQPFRSADETHQITDQEISYLVPGPGHPRRNIVSNEDVVCYFTDCTVADDKTLYYKMMVRSIHGHWFSAMFDHVRGRPVLDGDHVFFACDDGLYRFDTTMPIDAGVNPARILFCSGAPLHLILDRPAPDEEPFLYYLHSTERQIYRCNTVGLKHSRLSYFAPDSVHLDLVDDVQFIICRGQIYFAADRNRLFQMSVTGGGAVCIAGDVTVDAVAEDPIYASPDGETIFFKNLLWDSRTRNYKLQPGAEPYEILNLYTLEVVGVSNKYIFAARYDRVMAYDFTFTAPRILEGADPSNVVVFNDSTYSHRSGLVTRNYVSDFPAEPIRYRTVCDGERVVAVSRVTLHHHSQ